MDKRITQRDLAKIANVSPTTISLALRDHESISPTTRQRIKKLAAQHDYRPDPALSALNAYRNKHAPKSFHGTLGWVTNFSSPDGWKTLIQALGYFDGASKRADELGYRLESFWIGEPKLNAQRATDILLARGIRGLIIAPLPQAHSKLKLDWSQFCPVALGYSLGSPKLHVVMNHQFRNMKRVVEKLNEMGHRRIGLAMPAENDQRVDHSYLGGFLVAQSEFPPDAARLTPLLAKDFGEVAFTEWFRENNPDAIVVSPTLLEPISRWIVRFGLKIPRDVSLAAASVPYLDPTISGIDEDVPNIGAQAVETVVAMIHRNEKGIPRRPFSLLIEGDWTDGTTTRMRNRNHR